MHNCHSIYYIQRKKAINNNKLLFLFINIIIINICVLLAKMHLV